MHRIRQVLAIDDHITQVVGDRDTIVGFGTPREAMPIVLCGDFGGPQPRHRRSGGRLYRDVVLDASALVDVVIDQPVAGQDS